jgi:hypothetical protein
MLHGQKEVSFVSIIMFILRPDTLSLNGSVMMNQSINQSPNEVVFVFYKHIPTLQLIPPPMPVFRISHRSFVSRFFTF